jgi:SAM-dependent methyltransferase
MGGEGRLRTWTAMAASGRYLLIANGGREVPFTVWYKAPDRTRVDLGTGQEKATYAFDGTVAWFRDPAAGRRDPARMPEAQATEVRNHADQDPFVDYAAKGHRIEWLGTEVFEGVEAHAIRLTRSKGSQSVHLFDAGSGRELKIIIETRGNGSAMTHETIERDFRRVDWLLLPFDIETRVNGSPVRRMLIEHAEILSDLSDALFRMPAEMDAGVAAQGRWSTEWEANLESSLPSERIMDAIGITRGMQVAEIGAGNGRFAVRLARRVGPAGRVYANDVDRDALAFMRKRSRDERVENMVVIEGRETDPRLPQGSLGAVILVNTLHMVKEPVPLLRNTIPALKPGGVLAVIDFDRTKLAARGEAKTEAVPPKEHFVGILADGGFQVVSELTFLPRHYLLLLRVGADRRRVRHDTVREWFPSAPETRHLPNPPKSRLIGAQ